MGITAIIKLVPVLVLAAFMMSGFDALIAAPLATMVAAAVAMWTEKKNFSHVLDAAINNAIVISLTFVIAASRT